MADTQHPSKTYPNPAVGTRFGRLVVTTPSGSSDKNVRICKCLCDCGEVTISRVHALYVGKKRSCGCLQREVSREALKKLSTTHGKARTPTLATWQAMKQRCRDKNCEAFKNYGGRGIKVCDRWLGKNGFASFVEDMGPKPEGFEIERVDNDGNYEPGNCRWATVTEQANNRRNTRRFEYRGELVTIGELSRRFGVKYSTVLARLLVHGWTTEQAIRPVKGS